MVLQELVATIGLEVDESGFRLAESLMGLARGGMVAIATAAAAAAVGLTAAAAKAATYADGIERAAQRTGIGVESLQALQYAAERADVGAEGLQAALNFMAKRGVKDFEAELRRAADELAAMPDGGAKAARAMQLFGKQGAALIPMLNQGSAGLDEMTSKARLMGLVLGDDGVQAGAELKDAIEDLQGFIKGLALTIAGPLLKPVKEWLTSVARWIGANRAIIGQRIERTLGFIGDVLSRNYRLMEPFIDVIGRVGGALLDLITTAGPVKNFFMDLVDVVQMPLLVLEDLWGWITGKRRRTVFGDMLGPFEKFKNSLDAINPEDSGMVRAAKAIGRALSNAYEVATKLRFVLGLGATAGSTDADKAGKDLLSADRAVREKAVATLKGMGVGEWNGRGIDSYGPIFGGVPSQSRGGDAPSLYAPASPAMPAPAAAGPSIAVAQLVVNVPGGDAEAIAREVRGELDRQFRAAQPAVLGP